jgi:hypothetical protein
MGNWTEMPALYILSALLGWFGANYIYSLLPCTFKQNHPSWSASLVGGIIGLTVPALLNVLLSLLTK